MTAQSYAQPHGNLLFHWEPPRPRRLAILGFLAASAALHALCFYVFQVVYPPTISLLPPPARVSLIAPVSPEARSYLNWLEAEDPALASQTQRPADARAFQFPKLPHVPSYLAVPPRLKEPPPEQNLPATASAMPPGPVTIRTAQATAPTQLAPTTLVFSERFRELPVTHPELKFQASSRETPQSARFRIAVDSSGIVRYELLDQSSGDPALDEQARQYLALCRFEADPRLRNNPVLTWGMAAFEFGTDLQLPPSSAEPTP